MLVLTRKFGEGVVITHGDLRIVVRVTKLSDGKVRLGIVAPDDVNIVREELLLRGRGAGPDVPVRT